jgi:RNA polymerase sigma-70 factor (ECF subfamily)
VVDRATVLGALDRLSPEEREAVALRYGGDLTVPEVARLMREPVTTVEGRLYRGLRKLRDMMDA